MNIKSLFPVFVLSMFILLLAPARTQSPTVVKSSAAERTVLDQHASSLRAAPQPLAPGLYQAVPYTMLVYVPAPIDNRIAIEPRDRAVPPLTIEPNLRLIPRR